MKHSVRATRKGRKCVVGFGMQAGLLPKYRNRMAFLVQEAPLSDCFRNVRLLTTAEMKDVALQKRAAKTILIADAESRQASIVNAQDVLRLAQQQNNLIVQRQMQSLIQKLKDPV